MGDEAGERWAANCLRAGGEEVVWGEGGVCEGESASENSGYGCWGLGFRVVW